jgi:phosphatidate cytidylyltransferase
MSMRSLLRMSKKRFGHSHKVLFEDVTDKSFIHASERDLFSDDSTTGETPSQYSPTPPPPPAPLSSSRMTTKRASSVKRRRSQATRHDKTFLSGDESIMKGGSPLSSSPSMMTTTVPEERPINSLLLVSNVNKWKNWRVRTLWTIILLVGFVTIILAGHMFCALLIVGIQMFSFREIINLTRVPAREKRHMKSFRLLSWYFLLTTLHFFYGDKILEVNRSIGIIRRIFIPLALHHRFISFSLYTAGLVLFVLLLEKGHYKFQFFQFFWTHMTLLVVVVQSHFVIHNVFEGLIWFIMPAMLVIVNDIMAYICGFFFGRTPLIQLSPRKTWEGFIGAWLCTSIFAFFFSRFLMQFDYMTCSYEDYRAFRDIHRICTMAKVFIPVEYEIPGQLNRFLSLFLINWDRVYIAPLQWHALAMALFASLIAPFGGFFASGFKRAFKIKDFGDSIPGHGGITDRFDCQFLMGLFAYLYHTSFIRPNYATVENLLQTIRYLSEQDQLDLFNRFETHLKENLRISS